MQQRLFLDFSSIGIYYKMVNRAKEKVLSKALLFPLYSESMFAVIFFKS